MKSESNLIFTLRMSLLPPPLFVQISLSSLGLSENSKNHPNTHQSITNSWRRWVLGPSSIGAQLEPFMQEPVSKSPAERKAGNQRWATSLTPGRFVKNKTIVLLLCYFLAFRWVLDGSSSLLCCSVWFGWMSAIISARSEMERNPGPTNLTKSTFQIICREPTSFALSFASLWGCRIQSWTWPNEDEQRN